ncbi:MAG: 3-hydroxyacyl-CoA dehydrogenase NAD-binding domain-containing protein [Salinivirgaceae bacterium]|jgi:3-hydroxybutyryl-CoA dehydrogenase|nr:3-hydroxyacyl-CoA dehydrogenase NAD-binding domain-containing protein [Salinivirgaceae bacterium]
MSEIKVEPIEKYGLSAKSKPKSQFSTIGIVGCGNTGQRIALMTASKGVEVVFLELEQEKIDQAFREINEELDRRINHWGMTEGDKRSILSRIKGTLEYSDFKNCDLVIESILSRTREDAIETRKSVFRCIEEYVSEHAIIATNSTTLVITELASELKHKDRCISLHISTTAPEASTIEIVKGMHTSEAVCEDVHRFAKLIGKTAISVQESPGLVTARLFVSFISEACDVLMERVTEMENIDFVMRNGIGMPLGPFEMADKIGLDRVIRWMENLYEEFGDNKYKPSPILKRLVRAGYLGRKSGRGFYQYDENGQKIINSGIEAEKR